MRGSALLREFNRRDSTGTSMTEWVASVFGALDLSDSEIGDVDLLLLPTVPSEPIGISDHVASLWRRIAKEPVSDSDLDPAERELVREFAEVGIAEVAPESEFVPIAIDKPWFASPLHEMVSAMVASVACEIGIDAIFIKGPSLAEQGLRGAKHSGDVDVWVNPSEILKLQEALEEWGWKPFKDVWYGTQVHHSLTLKPQTWGCEIDLHRRFPGVGRNDQEAFTLVRSNTVDLCFASVKTRVPNREFHSVLSALHIVRPRAGVHESKTRQDSAAEVLRRGGFGAVYASRQLCADGALAAPLALAYGSRIIQNVSPLPSNWLWRTEKTRLRGYAALLKTATWRDRVILLRRLLWPPEEVLLEYSRPTSRTLLSRVSARVRRLRRVLSAAFQHVRWPL